MRSRFHPTGRPPARRGAILLVVLAMLALFAVLGLSFVLYAESAATSARINREAQDVASGGSAGGFYPGSTESSSAVGQALGQVLYDVGDTDSVGATSSFRGYGLVRLKYGFDRTQADKGLSPFAGTGLITDADQGVMPTGATAPPGMLDLPGGLKVFRSQVVNYAFQPTASNPFVIDPEWTGYRTDVTQTLPTSLPPGITQAYHNIAAPYTYPDLKDLCLAVVDTRTNVGRVLQPSYHRFGPDGTGAPADWFLGDPAGVPAWVFNGTKQISAASGTTPPKLSVAGPTGTPQTNPLMRLAPPASVSPSSNNGQAAADDDWLNAAGRLKILRPRPADHVVNGTTEFPYVPPNPDGTYTGDVQNLSYPGAQQRNDSLWMYPAGPIFTLPNGKQYTALVAPLVLDLGGRVNLSTAGNLLAGSTATVTPGTPPTATRAFGATPDHASSMGLGRWEVNPRWALDPGQATRAGLTADSKTALSSLLRGLSNFTTSAGPQNISGRYNTPTASGVPQDPVSGKDYFSFNGSLASDPAAAPPSTLRTPPHYSRLDVDGIGSSSASDIASPVGAQFTPFPTFANTRYFDDDTTKQKEFVGHPGQFSPSFYPSGNVANGRTFPATDMRWLSASVGGRPENYAQSDAAKLLNQHLIAGKKNPADPNRYDPSKPPSSPLSYPQSGPPTGTFNPNPYGVTTDPANQMRLLFTTISNSTHRPEVTVEARLPSGTSGKARLAPVDLARPMPDYRFAAPGTALPKWEPDNLLIPDTAHPNHANQAAQLKMAQNARQRLARDIFVRLAAVYSEWRVKTNQANYPVTVTGATAKPDLIDGKEVTYVDDPSLPDYGYLRVDNALTTASPAADRFLALRQLAQMAVNLVDYIDNDDINTLFHWNPATTAGGALNPDTVYNAGGVPYAADEIAGFLVYGTELPKLVITEAYSCVMNDRLYPNTGTPGGQGATAPVQTFFWAELHNPLSTDSILPEDGAARLFYKSMLSPGMMNQGGNITPYQLQVVVSSAAGAVTDNLKTASNILGDPNPGVDPPIQIGSAGGVDWSFNGDTTKRAAAFDPAQPPATPEPRREDQQYLVKPANGFASDGSHTNAGFYVVGPDEDFPTNPAPATFSASLRRKNATVAPSMTPKQATMSIVAPGQSANDVTNATNARYAIVLRRLANPFMPEQSNPNDLWYNPYITVDVFDGIKPNDLVKADNTTGTRSPTSSLPSTGRIHPYAGLNDATLVVNQTQDTTVPNNSFFFNNNRGSSPLAWLTHLDRQPVNSVELVHVSALPPSLLTNRFAKGGTTPTFNQHTAERLLLPGTKGGVDSFGAPNVALTGGELHKVIDHLAVRSTASTSVVGAPEAGKININAVWHPSILRSLFDAPAAGSTTPSNFFDEQDVDSDAVSPAPAIPGFWQKLVGGVASVTSPRTVSSSLDVNPAKDSPIWATGGAWSTWSADHTKNELQKTLLRRHDGAAGTATPLFYNPLQNPTLTAVSVSTEAKDHTHLVAEPLRKVWNNTATTSDTFLVMMTVGFFEVRQKDASGRVFLGQELYQQAPGDLRQKYVAVVDRSLAAAELNIAANGIPSKTGLQEPATPWFTTLSTDIVPGLYDLNGMNPPPSPPGPPYNPNTAPGMSNPLTCEIEAQLSGANVVVRANGEQITINPADTPKIRIGHGDNKLNNGEGELFMITAATAAPSGVPNRVQLTLKPLGLDPAARPTTNIRYHPAGSVVTNVTLGNPGPQPAFNPKAARYQNVVRSFERVYP